MMDFETCAIRDVVAERVRQHKVEGWTFAHDDQHTTGELAIAGAAYAVTGGYDIKGPPWWWPFSREWWKPKSTRENLVRAAALIIAEIERIDRSRAEERCD